MCNTNSHVFAVVCCNAVYCFLLLPVLTAINEDSPTVPALLTDYILNGKWAILIRVSL